MRDTTLRSVLSLAAAAVLMAGVGAAPASATGPAADGGASPAARGAGSGAAPVVGRLAGDTRYDTAAAIAAGTAASRPVTVRIVRGDRPLDAVARAGEGSPVLYLPPSGPIPRSVRSAYATLRPARVLAVGSERVLPTARVRQLVGRARLERDTFTDPARYALERAAARINFGTGDDCTPWSIGAMAITSTASVAAAAAAAQIDALPVALLPDRGPLPTVDMHPRCNGYRFNEPFTIVGGPGAVSEARVATLEKSLEMPRPARRDRIAGADRYATTAALSRRARPRGAHTVYLAGGTADADAAAATGLTDGPVLLVPACNLPEPVAAEIWRLKPRRVVALGGTSVVCDATLQEAARLAASAG